MAMTSTHAARVRDLVGHPIIDADGHFVEVGPLLHDEIVASLEDAGRRRAARPVPRRRRRRRSTRRRASPTATTRGAARSGGRCRRGGAGRPQNVRDRATSHLPALLYERLDEMGIDFTILYPSMALGYFDVADDELGAVLCRAVNRGARPRSSRRTPTAARSARWSR